MFFLLAVTFLLFGLIFYSQIRDKTVFVYAFPLLSLLLDFLVMHFTAEGGFSVAMLRGLASILLIAILWIRYVKISKFMIPLLLYFVYLLTLLVIWSDTPHYFMTHIAHVFKINISLFLFPLAYYCINTFDNLRKLNNILVLVLVLFCSYIVAANLFGFGGNMYLLEDQEIYYYNLGLVRTGGFGGNSMNVLAYIIALAPIIDMTTDRKSKKNFQYFLFAIGIIVLLLVLRRSSLVIVVVAMFGYGLWRKKGSGNDKKYFVGIAVFVLVLVPIFWGDIMNILELRGVNKFTLSVISLEKRSVETVHIFGKIFSFADPYFSWFGAGFHAKPWIPGIAIERPLHADYDVILYKTGLVGLLLYSAIIIAIIMKFRHLSKYYYHPLFASTFWVLIVTSTLLAYSGRFTAITFRSILFLYLGAILGIYANSIGRSGALKPAFEK